MPTKTARPPTRQRLIEAAGKRFYRDGFRNSGIDAILDDVGISKPAFYKHFESKDDLMIAVLEDIDQFLRHRFRRIVEERGGPSAVGQLRALLEVVHEIMSDQSFHGCIFVSAAMEFPLAHDPAHKIAAQHKRAIEQFIYELAERAGVAEPGALAQEMCLVIEGAFVTRSVTGDSATIDIARRVIEQVLCRHLDTARRT